ncbi:hypothetical protein HS125_11665 [bacterium]|nr:hypothetical protein [bacterium]
MRRRLLFLSNGPGEDSLAGRILDRLLPWPEVEVHAWCMVGEGSAYRRRAIPLVGAPNLLPGHGLSLVNPRYLWNDLRAGWITTHWRQYRTTRELRGRYDLAVAVGDVVPIAAASLAGIPFLFVGCAKSAYYGRGPGRYTRLEKYFLRRHCRMAFPRDRWTTDELAGAGVPARYVGNPMMDDLEPTGESFGLPSDTCVITLLPGSRSDTLDNLRELLEMGPAIAAACPRPAHFLVAAHDDLDASALLLQPPEGWKATAPRPEERARGVALSVAHESGLGAILVKGRFADAVLRAEVVIGLAGTANEQAIGLGRPVVAFPARGFLGEAYVRMKARYYGPAVLTAARSAEAVAGAVRRIFVEPGLRETMVQAGRERMGGPGASAAIAAEIRRGLETLESGA